MIRLSHLSYFRGEQCLVKDANVSIHAGWKLGLVGHNGTGKSSLFALLQGELLADRGDVELAAGWQIAHMAQEVDALSQDALSYVLDGNTALRQVEQDIAQANEQTDAMQLAAWHETFERLDGYRAEAKAQALLAGLGFAPSDVSLPVSEFSGGWRIRLNLARTLYQPSDLLLLDEPTNHLDLETVLWLQDYLRAYQGTLMLISHDRDFLDAVCGHILHIHQQQLTLYTGNYSSFERQRAERLSLQTALYQKQQAHKAHLEDFVRRFRAKATKAKQAQSRLKALERMTQVQMAHAESPFQFSLPASAQLSSPLLSLQLADIGYQQPPVLSAVNFSLLPGMRIGLLGMNGAGKSTLIKSMIGQLSLLAGKRVAGTHLQIGYFSQHQTESLDAQASPLLHIQRLAPTAKEQEIRDFLGGFGFVGDAALAAVEHFSGGEKARLALALLAWQRPNLLLLDEPTNHLDLDMREALVQALQAFDGALVLVSHDRHLLASCIDEFWLVAAGKVTPFAGDVDDYLQWIKQQSAQQALSQREHKTQLTAESNTSRVDKKQDRKEAAELRERLRPLKKRIQQLEKELDAVSLALSDVEAQLADADVYQAERKQDLQDLLQQQASLKGRLSAIEEAWLSEQEALVIAEQAS